MSGVRIVEEGSMKKSCADRENETRETAETETWTLAMVTTEDIAKMTERDLRETIPGTHEIQEMFHLLETHETYHPLLLETHEMCHRLAENLNLQLMWIPLVET